MILATLAALVMVLPGPLKSLAQTTDTPRVRDSEEYSVYSAILDSQFASDKPAPIVINSATFSAENPAVVGDICGLAPTGAKRPDVDPATTTDFDAKSEKSSLLKKRFNSKTPYVLVTDQELRAIFAEPALGHIGPAGWTLFHQRYPGTPGILTFSRVGFDSKKSQALVYVAYQEDCLGGSGSLVVLSREDSSWKVRKTVVLWRS